MQINGLDNFRYSITNLPNVVPTTHGGIQFGLLKKIMGVTYEKLASAHVDKLKVDACSEQVIRNHMAALRNFIQSCGKSMASPIGNDLNADFGKLVELHLEHSKLSERSRYDRRSLLNAWRVTFKEMNEDVEVQIRRPGRDRPTSAIPSHGRITAFEKCLKDALKRRGIAGKTAARLAGVSFSAVSRWQRGALPNARSVVTLEKLDTVLKLPKGTLHQALQETIGILGQKAVPNAFRERQKERSKMLYKIKISELTCQFISEWNDFLNYKTSIRPSSLKRSMRGQWKLSDVKHMVIKPTILNSKGALVSASADNFWHMISSFIGYLEMPADKGGYGLQPQQGQSLAWLAVPDAIHGYLEFLTRRSAEIQHGGHRVFCGYVLSMTNSNHGYLCQVPSLSARLPADVLGEATWSDLCKQSHETARAWKIESSGVSRKPSEPLQALLDADEPLAPIIEAMRTIRRVGDDYPHNSIHEALARRDELLLGFLLYNPLRSKNISTLTYYENNTGNIYRSPLGVWRVRIPSRQFKNGKRKSRDDYDVQVATWLVPLIEDYIRYYRKKFVKEADPGYFFLTRNGVKITDLYHIIQGLTRRYVPATGGIGPHAFRHLVATDWLKRNPNDFFTAAVLLNDAPRTVMENYAHLRTDSAFGRYESYVENIVKARY